MKTTVKKLQRLSFKSFWALVLAFSTTMVMTAQEGIGTNSPDPSSALDVSSTTKGILIPRMTSAQRTAIVSPAEGLRVYDTTTNDFWYFDGTTWVQESVAANNNPFNDNTDGSIAVNGDANIYLPGNRLQVGADGTGAVAMTLNDGGGNANITFNHAARNPDQNGSSARITSGVDGTNANMIFSVQDDVTAGTVTGTVNKLIIEEEFVQVNSQTNNREALRILREDNNQELGIAFTNAGNAKEAVIYIEPANATDVVMQDALTIAARGLEADPALLQPNASFLEDGRTKLYNLSDATDPYIVTADADGILSRTSATGLNDNPWDNPDGTVATQASTDINFTNGDVGIGTTNPAANLHIVQAASSVDPVLKIRNNADTADLNIYTNTDTGAQVLLQTGGGDDLAIKTDAGSRTEPDLFIDRSNGRVGLGTTTPGDELTIAASDYPGVALQEDTSGGIGSMVMGAGALRQYSSGSQAIFIDGDNNTTDAYFQVRANTGAFSGGNTIANFYENGTTSFFGNVGVGKVDPVDRLEVIGSRGVFASHSGNAGYGFFGSTNNVHITQNAYYDGAWKARGSATGKAAMFRSGVGQDIAFTVQTNNTGTLVADGAIGWQRPLTLTMDGNLGLGTTAPQSRLHLLDADNDDVNAIQVTAGNMTRAHGIVSVNGGQTLFGANLKLDVTETGGTHDGYVKGTNLRGAAGILSDNLNEGTGNLRFLVSADTNDDTFTVEEVMNIQGTGQVRMHNYGAGSFTGTTTGLLGVTANGTIVEATTSSLNDNPWDNPDGTVADQSSTDINYMNGNVGIGTATPQTLLHAYRNTGFATFKIESGSSGSGLWFNKPNDALSQFRFDNAGSKRWDMTVSGGDSGVNTGSGLSWSSYNNDGSFAEYVLTMLRNGNVGLGVSNPTERLEVNGKVRVSDLSGAAAATDVIVTADATTGELKNAGTLADVNNNPWDNPDGTVADQSSTDINYMNGNVGIGTTTPVDVLSVTRDQDAVTAIGINNSDTGANARSYLALNGDAAALALTTTSSTYAGAEVFGRPAGIAMYTNAGATGGFVFGARGSTAPISFHTGGSDERMRIAADGNVGIGTVNPASSLEVLDGVKNAITIQTPNNSSDAGLAYRNQAGQYVWSMYRTDSGTDHADLVFAGGPNDPDVNNLPERLRITEEGNVGIGTAQPTTKFVISGEGADSGDMHGYYYGANNSPSSINFRRARGTEAAPAAVQNSDLTGAIYSSGFDGTAWTNNAAIQIQAAEDWSNLGRGTRMLFQTTGIGATNRPTRMNIGANGNIGIGIGNTDGDNTLHVSAAADPIKLEGLQDDNSATNKVVVADTNGVLKTTTSSAIAPMASVFYPPATPVNITTTGTGFTLDLHQEYVNLYGTPAVSSPSAGSLPTFAENELDYHVLSFDTTVFTNVTVSDTGILTYDVTSVPPSNTAYFNVVFQVR